MKRDLLLFVNEFSPIDHLAVYIELWMTIARNYQNIPDIKAHQFARKARMTLLSCPFKDSMFGNWKREFP